MFLKYDHIKFKFYDIYREDLSKNYKKELEVCKIFSTLINEPRVFDISLITEEVEDIYLLLVEKAYRSENEHHKFLELISENPQYELENKLDKSIKKKLKIAFNKFMYSLFGEETIIKYLQVPEEMHLPPPPADKTGFLDRNRINMEITFRCPLECPRCQRSTSFTSKGKKVKGEDISVEDFTKIVKHFKYICFCGQVSDPCHHPKFIELLKIAWEHKCYVSVHHATAHKKIEWYKKAWAAHPEALWYFAIDGLPKDSNIYRINQDGEYMYEVLKESVKHLHDDPIWQYIVFSYNENDVNTAATMAQKIGVRFNKLISSRWLNDDDPLKPSRENSLDR